MRKMLTVAVAAFCIASFSHESRAGGDDDVQQGRCTMPQGTVALVQKQLSTVVNLGDANGGIFMPNRM
jgi:hypothetical protein